MNLGLKALFATHSSNKLEEFNGTKLLFATHNTHKFNEFKETLKLMGIEAEVVSCADLGIPEPVEDGATFFDNALIKLGHAEKYAPDHIIIAEDSGLCIKFDEKESYIPGVMSARYAQKIGKEPTIQNNVNLLYEELKMEPGDTRPAFFVCVMTCKIPGVDSYRFWRGCMQGEFKHIGTESFDGFGYDPYFLVNGVHLPAMGRQWKLENSHRAEAIRGIMNPLRLQFPFDGQVNIDMKNVMNLALVVGQHIDSAASSYAIDDELIALEGGHCGFNTSITDVIFKPLIALEAFIEALKQAHAIENVIDYTLIPALADEIMEYLFQFRQEGATIKSTLTPDVMAELLTTAVLKSEIAGRDTEEYVRRMELKKFFNSFITRFVSTPVIDFGNT